ncbi:MAG: hypothetical protein KatS3mg102_0175 [Planctomycetota bacterium]|nr:MAG: hypothetical protein KatS3mg102_0175 [Planctomycetota bacterium]
MIGTGGVGGVGPAGAGSAPQHEELAPPGAAGARAEEGAAPERTGAAAGRPLAAAELDRRYGRIAVDAKGRVMRDEAWVLGKRERVDRIHRFAERYPSAAARYLTQLTDVNFSRGVYARAEVMSLVNDYLVPLDAEGRPSSAEWAAYIAAHERGASELELARLFFRAHNAALARAQADPAYAAARAAADPKMLGLCDITLGIAEQAERRLQDSEADPHQVMIESVARFMAEHARAGYLPLNPGDLQLWARAADLSPLEKLLDRVRGAALDEVYLARAMRTMAAIQEAYLKDRLQAVGGFVRRLIDRFRA